MSKVKFKFEKLVRDLVPFEMVQNNIEVHYKILSSKDRIVYLRKKLLEEIHELCTATTRNEIIAEIGDVYDVLNELYALNQIVLQHNFEMDIYSLHKNLIQNAQNIAIETFNDDKKILIVYELLYCLIKALNVDIEEIFVVRQIKYEKRGGFKLGIYINYIEICQYSNAEAVQYFKNLPEKYLIIL